VGDDSIVGGALAEALRSNGDDGSPSSGAPEAHLGPAPPRRMARDPKF